MLPKLGTNIEMLIIKKIKSKNQNIDNYFTTTNKNILYIKDYGETYWIFPFSFVPYLPPIKSFNELYLNSEDELKILTVVLNSNLFYWFYTLISDCWHFNKWHINKFQVSITSLNDYKDLLISCHNILINSYKKNRNTRYDSRINGDLYEYKIAKSKSIIDEIDKVLARHYGFTDEELDFIINYDIKYRMGSELEDDEE